MNNPALDTIAKAFDPDNLTDYERGLIEGYALSLCDMASAVTGSDASVSTGLLPSPLEYGQDVTFEDIDGLLCAMLGDAVKWLSEHEEPHVPMSEYRRVFHAMQEYKKELDHQRKVINLPPSTVEI